MKKLTAIVLLLAVLCALCACSPSTKTTRGFAMGSEYYVTFSSSKDFSSEISEMLSSIEESFSTKVATSVISRINAAKASEPIMLSEEENAVLKRCFDVAEGSNGAFEPSILPLVKAWGFDPPYDMNGSVPPNADAIERARAISDRALFIYDKDRKSIYKLNNAACLDLGGAIKGYAAEKVRDLAKERAEQALVYIGGTIAAVGKSYEIGVTPPRDSEESYAFRFTLSENEICATSGDYERYYIYENERYHHILDAKTGRPATSGVISATIVTEDGILADALATAVVVLGVDEGLALLEKCGAKGAIVTTDKKVVTYGLTVTIKDASYVLA